MPHFSNTSAAIISLHNISQLSISSSVELSRAIWCCSSCLRDPSGLLVLPTFFPRGDDDREKHQLHSAHVHSINHCWLVLLMKKTAPPLSCSLLFNQLRALVDIHTKPRLKLKWILSLPQLVWISQKVNCTCWGCLGFFRKTPLF